MFKTDWRWAMVAFDDDDDISFDPPSEDEDFMCPDCGSAMRLRTGKTSGKRFYGCVKFPRCRGARGEDGRAWKRQAFGAAERQPVAASPVGPSVAMLGHLETIQRRLDAMERAIRALETKIDAVLVHVHG